MAPRRHGAAGPGHGDQAAGHGRLGRGPVHQPAQLLLQRPELGGFGPALLAGGQVRVGAVPFGSAELAVDQGGQPVTEMAHGSPLRTRALRWSAGAGLRCSSAERSWARPRWILLRTVPSFTPRVAAISS